MKKPIPASLFFILSLCTLVLVAVLLILGGVSPGTNKKILLATIKTNWQNPVNPEATERYITGVLEKSLLKIPQPVNIQSSSDEKQSVINVFTSGPDESGEMFFKIRETLADCERELPRDIVSPPVLLKPVNQKHVLLFTLETSNLSPEKLRKVGVEAIAPLIDAFAGVQQTEVLGGQESVLRICPDPFRLRAAGIDRISLQQEIKHAQIGTGTGVLTGWKNSSDLLESLDNMALFNARGEKYFLKDFCTISMGGEWDASLSGRQERPAVTIMVYCKNDVVLSVMREKILRKLRDVAPVAGGLVNINPFITEDKPVYTFIPPDRAALVCAIGFFFLLLLCILADLSRSKKILVLVAAGILLVLAPVILYNLKKASVDEIFQFSVEVPDNAPREEKETLALQLAAKLRNEAGAEDLVWYSNQETTGDPATANKINFQVKLTKTADRNGFIEMLRKKIEEEIEEEIGMQLTGLSPGENGFPRLYQVIVKGPELENLMEQVRVMAKEIKSTQGITHVWTEGDAIRPAIECQMDHGKMAEQGIPLFSPNCLIGEQDLLSSMDRVKIKIGCKTNEPEDFSNIAVTNVKGEQVPLSAFAQVVKVAYPKAIYHYDLERCMRLYFMADDESTAERVKEILSRMAFQQKSECLMIEGE